MIGPLVTAMGKVIISWLVLFCGFAGLGLLLRRAVAGPLRTGEQLAMCFWLGYALMICFLQVWHLMLPVDWRAGVVLLCISACGLLTNRRELFAIGWPSAGTGYLKTVLIVGAALFFANQAIGPPISGDTGSYHLNTIGWLTQHSIVPGLGNLHGRLAFNQSHFLYPALLESSLWAQRSFHIANSLLIVVFAAQIIGAGHTVIVSREKVLSKNFFLLLAGLPMCLIIAHTRSVSPDLPVFILGILICSSLFDFLIEKAPSTKEALFSLMYVAVLSVLGITVKLSFAAQAGMATLTGLYLYYRFVPQPETKIIRAAGLLILCWMVFLIPWIMRGFVLSGYPAYPATLGKLGVEWDVPQQHAVQMAQQLKGWARLPGGETWREALDGWAWVMPWLQRLYGSAHNIIQMVIPLLLAVVVSAGVFLTGILKGQPDQGMKRHFIIIVPWVLGLVFWFFTAPDPRFSGSVGWILAACVLTIAFDQLDRKIKYQLLRPLCFFCIFVTVFLVLAFNVRIYRPGPDKGFHPAPEPHLKTYTVQSGFTLYTPGKTGCWYGPLVYTPWPDPNLRLRKEGDVGSGFVTLSGGLKLK